MLAGAGRPRRTWVGGFGRRPTVYGAIAAYAVLSTVLMVIHQTGITSEHALLLLLVAVSIAAPLRAFVWDWLPFLGVWVMFDDLGAVLGPHGMAPHAIAPIVTERALLGGQVACVWLQQHLRPAVPWLDVPLTVEYLTFFAAPLAFALWLWLRQRGRFGIFVSAYIALMAMGFAVWVLYPETPPWLAAREGLLPHVSRITVGMLDSIGVGGLYSGADPAPNGAMPSLHVAVPTLIAGTLVWIRGSRRRAPWLWFLYPLTMAFATIYLGEHYVLDGLAGMGLGALCFGGTAAWSRWAVPRHRGDPVTASAAEQVEPGAARQQPLPMGTKSGMAGRRAVGFAHRGGMADRPENTLAAFTHARALGAPGFETDAWLTVDGAAVLHHDASLRRPPRRRIAELRRDQLPEWIPTLGDLYRACGTALDIAVDVMDPRAAPALIAAAVEAGGGAPGRLWLCSTDLEQLAGWRSLHGEIHLVHSDPEWRRHRRDADGRCRLLAERGIEVLNLRRHHCTPALTAACHRNGLKLFAWGVQRRRTMRRLLALGVDGLMSDHADRLAGALGGRER